MAASLELGLGPLPCCQLRLVLKRGIMGIVVKVTQGPEAGVIGLVLPQGVTPTSGGVRSLDRVFRAAGI